ncbi:hypothetical protein ACFLSV_02005, partial [Bacteroidota bacterium]
EKILSLNYFKLNKTNTHPVNLRKNKKISEGEFLSVAIGFWLLNPMLLYENKKIYFGLTKEISVGFLYRFKLSLEYSYIFRDANNNHLRSSLNYIIPLSTSDFVVITTSIGAGYFTDTKKSGFFPQGSIEFMIAPTDNIVISLYSKLRHTITVGTFNPGTNKSNITDLSLGIATIFVF